MQYHAIIEKAEEWWIGWLVDLPGVNAQERTKEELLESLKIAAEDMLDLKGVHDPSIEIMVQSTNEAGSSWKVSRNQVAGQSEETTTKD
ncbi:MAG: type II toxin-antitoxin system HicB family antitoxin [Desulfomonile tiedjei]|uniref:Type II toxin-antitoxin system HicB family antitoxin n=1 Tax=Desulfomonile tiedjei TaxID=2358 RepID=A0A9D6UYL3_9BACT|nr:type II toxin-antitoxin system HicB family antitoxin [Desulfomonile tiedjei]